MKKNSLFVLLLIMITISACKKEDEIVSHLVKTITVGSTTSTFTYDSQKRVTQINVSNNKRYEFAYFNNDSIIRYDYDGATYLGRIWFLFDANGRNSTTFKLYSSGTQLTHDFNSSGEMYYLTLSSSSQTRDSLIHTNKNVTTVIHEVSAATETREIITIQYNDKPNTLNRTSFGMQFLPSFYYSTLNVNSLAYIYNTTNQNLAIKEGDNITYTYEFDSKDRITKRIKRNTASFIEPIYVEEFTYYE